MLHPGSLSIILLHVICVVFGDDGQEGKILNHDDISEEMRKDASTKLSSFLETNSMQSLPIHSTEVRPSSCGDGVQEEFILYK